MTLIKRTKLVVFQLGAVFETSSEGAPIVMAGDQASGLAYSSAALPGGRLRAVPPMYEVERVTWE